jgi:hypothetical protein
MPKIVQSIPEDAARWLKVDGFEIQIPTDIDPMTLDRFAVSVEVSVTTVRPDFKLKEIYTKVDGQKVATGRIARSEARWLYLSGVVAGSASVEAYEKAPEQLMLVVDEPSEETS